MHNGDILGQISSRVSPKGSKEDSYKYGSEDIGHQSKACLKGHSLQDIKEFDTIQYNAFTDLIPIFDVKQDKLRAMKKVHHPNFQLI
jgi:hypothetical protein